MELILGKIDMQTTSNDKKIGTGSLNITFIIVLIVCITAVFCFGKMEQTTSETKRIEELAIQRNNSERDLILAKAGKYAPEYRPIIIGFRTVTAGTAYQPSTTRFVDVSISVQIACSVTLGGGQAGNYALQTSPDGVTYTTIAQMTNSSTGTLVVGLTLNNSNGCTLVAKLPPGYYYKLVSTTTTGTPTFSILTPAEETQL